MNKHYKIVFQQRTGQCVVTSENAKGAKKSKVSQGASQAAKWVVMSLAACASIQSFAITNVALDESYTSGGLVYSSGKVTKIDSTNSANLQKKMKVMGTGVGAETSSDQKFSTDLKQKTQFLPDPNGPKTKIPIETLDLKQLDALGAITIIDKTTGKTLTKPPVWEDWDLNATDAKSEITWDKSDGSQGTVAVYNIDKIYLKNQSTDSLNYTQQRITAQPTEPFYRLSMQKINQGELTLQGDKIDWKPGQVKQSSFFIADGSSAKIQQKTPIKITFDNTASLKEIMSAGIQTTEFGPDKMLSGATLNVDGKNFTINSVAALKNYNNALIQAITTNVIASSEYASRFNKAFKSANDPYQLIYDPSKGYEEKNQYYYSDAMLAAIGKRAIFEGTKNSEIHLYENVAAIGETWAHAYNVWLHDQGNAINHGEIDIAHTDTQNALVESGSTYTNNGSLNFNISRSGTNWADQVKGAGSSYLNEGKISVSSSAKRSPKAAHPNQYYKASRNIALEISEGASAENKATGEFFIGTTAGAGTATGVHINESGTFTNNGKMTVGKNAAGQDQTLSGGVNSETLNLDESFAAISAYINESKPSNQVRISNNGDIDITQTAKNTAAINIGFKDPTVISASKLNVEVNNTGNIVVDGANSVGLKAAGFKTLKADGIKNTGEISVSGLGSSGIFASNGAEIVNDGKVTIDGRQTTQEAKQRPYGIRSDNALVTLTENSEIEVLGSYSVGLYARVGGTIEVNGGTIDVPKQTDAKGQVVFWISGKNDAGKSSEIKFARPANFSLENDGSTLFRIDNKATYVTDASNQHVMNINGKGSTGYYITDKGSSFDSGLSVINVNGEGSTGIYVNGGAGLDDKVVLSADTKLNVSGKDATVAVVDGNKYDIVGNVMSKQGARLISNANLQAGPGGQIASGAIGYWLLNDGELQHDGQINFTQVPNATGVKVEGGHLNNTGTIAVNGVGVDVYGPDSIVQNNGDITATNGIAAIRLNEGAQLELTGNASQKVKGENTADAIRVHAGASLTTKDANIEVDGSGSGIHFLNSDGDAKGPFKLNGTGNIIVTGNNAAGITLEGQDANGNPTMGSSDLDTRGSEKLLIQVKDTGGNGIVTNTSGNVASGTSVNIESAVGQSALVVKGETQSVIQSGNLNSNSATAVVDLSQSSSNNLSFENSGKILSNATNGVAVKADAANKNVSFTNKNSGQIKGDIVLGDGNNVIYNLNKGKIEGTISAGNGKNTVNLANTSKTDEVVLGDGQNNIDVSNQATLSKLTAGNGQNTVNLKDQSKTQTVALGDGGNTINIYGETDNGNISSGTGADEFTLYGVEKDKNNIIFDQLDAGGGVDKLTVTENSHYVLDDPSKIQNFENLNIEKNSVFEINNVELALNNTGGNTGIISVDKDSTYFINFSQTASDYLMQYQVSGDGTIQTDTNNKAFNFDPATAAYTQNNFNGTLQLGNGTLALENANTQALTNATLQLDPNGIAFVKAGNGVQKIGGLTFNDGTLDFEKDFIGSQVSGLNSHIEVKVLDVTKKGQVNIITDGFDNDFDKNGALRDLSQLSLLEHDDGVNLVELVKATEKVIGDGVDINIDIKKTTGEIVTTPDSIEDIRQNGQVVAKGTYGIGSAVWGPSNLKDGLYAGYLLKEAAIVDQQTLNLESVAGAKGKGLEFRAKITNDGDGSGHIEINSNSDHVALVNHNNDYTGTTTVNKGRLILGADTVLGQENQHTSELILKENTQVQFNDTTQYIGRLTTDKSSELSLDTGVLNIDDGGLSEGRITSEKDAILNVKAGTLEVMGKNEDYHGTTQIQKSATVNIYDTAGLGDGDIQLSGRLNIDAATGNFKNNLSKDGQLNTLNQADIILKGNNTDFSGSFNNSADSVITASETQHLGSATVNNEGNFIVTGTKDWKIENIVQGTGQLIKQGTNTIELGLDAARYTGATRIEMGSLVVGNKDQPIDLLSKSLIIQPNGTFAGFGSTAGSVDNAGHFIVGELDKSTSNEISRYLVKGNFNNAGKISLGGASGTGSILDIEGDYISNSGQLHINTVLNEGKANTQTDQLKIGKNVVMGTGATLIYVKPVGGQGAQTQPDAIKVVDVSGKTAGDAFKLGHAVAMGVYEYTLQQGSNDQSWYLSNYTEPQPPVEPPVQPPVEPPVQPPVEPPVQPPVEPPKPDQHVSPMLGAYLANQNALRMFNMTLHDRLGEPQYAESLKSESTANSMWLRSVITNEKYHLVNDALSAKGDQQILQLGMDIIDWDQFANQKEYRARLGVMAAFGQQDYDSISRTTGSRAYAKVENAYSAGIYGTIYQDSDTPLASYVDAWAMYNWYDNKVGMQGYDTSSYDSTGYNLSVEAGHTFIKNAENGRNTQWQIQPQVQLTYGQSDSDESIHNSGLHMNARKSDYLESRVGGRMTYLNDLTKTNQIQPFAEFNWHHQYEQMDMRFNQLNVRNDYPEDRYEFKLGFEGNTTKNFNGWGNISYSFGKHDYQQVEAMAGIKYQW